MAKKALLWKKGAGKLGLLTPLLGKWRASADSPLGTVTCTREFALVLHGAFVRLDASWDFGGKQYLEHAVYGVQEGALCFWSFTSDGKRSSGKRADGSDVHPEALAFEAEMPAGRARMVYWPDEDGSVHWAVESRTKKGWKRFTQHRYTKV